VLSISGLTREGRPAAGCSAARSSGGWAGKNLRVGWRCGPDTAAALLTAGLACSVVPLARRAGTGRQERRSHLGAGGRAGALVAADDRTGLGPSPRSSDSRSGGGGLFGRADPDVPRPSEGGALNEPAMRSRRDDSKELPSTAVSSTPPANGRRRHSRLRTTAAARGPPPGGSAEGAQDGEDDHRQKCTCRCRLSSRTYWFAQVVATALRNTPSAGRIDLDAERQVTLSPGRRLRDRLVDLRVPARKVTVHTRFVNRRTPRTSQAGDRDAGRFAYADHGRGGRFVCAASAADAHCWSRRPLRPPGVSVVAGLGSRSRLSWPRGADRAKPCEDTGSPPAARLMVMCPAQLHARTDADGR
jgi:hypothetical protein